MVFRFLLFFVIISGALPTGIAYGQENSSLTCSDGIDNDGDGLIDCEDGDCASLGNANGCGICQSGRSFADAIISYEPGCALQDFTPDGAVGAADYNGNVFRVDQFCFLGDGGILKVAFTDNLLTTSGNNDFDLHIFEIGQAVEACDIAVRPINAFTENAIQNAGLQDPNADGFYDIGRISGATSSIDLDVLVPGFVLGELLFDAVEIRDVPDRGCSGLTPGADIDAICALAQPPDCAGVPGGNAILDSCGVCLEPTDPTFNQSCTDCAGTPNGTAIIDSCGICLEPTDPTFNQSCTDCAGTPNGAAIIDSCGICLEPTDPVFNQSCTDCAGTPNGTAILDECGVCLEPTDPTFNQSCTDCAGTINGTAILDSCGVCLEPTDPTFNQSCTDCAGTPNGTAVIDSCGICLEPTDPTFNQSCTDCAGTPNGTAVIDSCGICLEPTDPKFDQSCTDCAGTPNGTAVIDSCGICLEPTDPDYNQCLIIDQNIEIHFPNAFSPNGDGVNDVFSGYSNTEQEISIDWFRIFDRWGNLVYEIQNIPFGFNTPSWDGTFSGQEAEIGVYVFVIQARTQGGLSKIYTGEINLIR